MEPLRYCNEFNPSDQEHPIDQVRIETRGGRDFVLRNFGYVQPEIAQEDPDVFKLLPTAQLFQKAVHGLKDIAQLDVVLPNVISEGELCVVTPLLDEPLDKKQQRMLAHLDQSPVMILKTRTVEEAEAAKVRNHRIEAAVGTAAVVIATGAALVVRRVRQH